MRKKHIIAVVGDGKIPKNEIKYKLALSLGKALIDNGYRIFSGGKGGVMEAVSKGARSSENHQPGDVIGLLPGPDKSEGNEFLDIAIPTGMGQMRNFLIAKADAVVAIGGGAGTLSEIAMAWINRRMVLAYRVEGWSEKLADTKIDSKKRIDWEQDCVFGVDSAEGVIEMLELHLWRYPGLQ